jgi:hypothetical protein
VLGRDTAHQGQCRQQCGHSIHIPAHRIHPSEGGPKGHDPLWGRDLRPRGQNRPDRFAQSCVGPNSSAEFIERSG